MPIKYLNPADGTEILVYTGECIGPLEDVISIEDIVDTENIQLTYAYEIIIGMEDGGRVTGMLTRDRKPEQRLPDYLNYVLMDIWPSGGRGFWFSELGKKRMKEMFPEIFNNNWKRMHGKPLYRRPLKERQRRKDV